jgi:hypothetical protein
MGLFQEIGSSLMDLMSDNSAVIPGTNSARVAMEMDLVVLLHVGSSELVSEPHCNYLTTAS